MVVPEKAVKPLRWTSAISMDGKPEVRHRQTMKQLGLSLVGEQRRLMRFYEIVPFPLISFLYRVILLPDPHYLRIVNIEIYELLQERAQKDLVMLNACRDGFS